jgi:hypothetical protein
MIMMMMMMIIIIIVIIIIIIIITKFGPWFAGGIKFIWCEKYSKPTTTTITTTTTTTINRKVKVSHLRAYRFVRRRGSHTFLTIISQMALLHPPPPGRFLVFISVSD